METNDTLLEALSLFSIVQFPNQQCAGSSSSSTYGTCYTSSECSSRGGSADGNCAAGFGVCCVISTSTCGSSVSTNTTYIRNPGYPSSYTPTNAGTCTFTIRKVSDDICQLREGIISYVLIPRYPKLISHPKDLVINMKFIHESFYLTTQIPLGTTF